MTVSQRVDFNSSLPIFASLIAREINLDALRSGVFVRDGFGRLSFFYDETLKKQTSRKIEKAALKELRGYAAQYGAIHDSASPAYRGVIEANRLHPVVTIENEEITLNIVDRRFAGRDWLSFDKRRKVTPAPVLVFCSLKGGVGRTTALLMLATSLSRRGRNVIIFDLDLEAPGIGSMAFVGKRPQYGAIDYLVESAVGTVSDDDLSLFVGQSALMDDDVGQGRVDIVPATGARTYKHPSSMMAKLARAVVERPMTSGEPMSLGHQLGEMIERISAREKYDVVLVDARAGLAEITAGPLLALGAEVAIFGTDQPHTFEGYRYLLSHLAQLPVEPQDDWRRRFHFVHAKARASAESRLHFDDALYEVLSDTFYELDEGDDVFNFNLDDSEAPHIPWRVFFNTEYIDADPVVNRSLIEEDVFAAAFGSFISDASRALGLDEDPFEKSDDAF